MIINDENDEIFLFADENVDNADDNSKRKQWKILVVDDEKAIHASTKFVLNDYEYNGASVELLHAYSSKEAKDVLDNNTGIALILLDVVMETDNAGLEFVGYVREDLNNSNIRIILRTGQAGSDPEWKVINKYDINDYKTKTELTQERLFTTVTTALRSFEQINYISSSTTSLKHMLEGAPELFGIRNIDKFAKYILEQFNLILDNVNYSFISMAQDNVDIDEMLITYAINDDNNLAGRRLFGYTKEKVQELIISALEEKKHIIESNSICVYIETRHKHKIVVYMEMSEKIETSKIQLLDVFCINATIGLENLDLILKSRKLAYYDRLTGIGNRSLFIEKLNNIITSIDVEKGDKFAIITIDIDHFDEINDLVGQKNADNVIKAFADRLVYTNPHSLIVARVSGDEFALIYKISGDNASGINDKLLLRSFDQPFHVLDYTIPLKASAGICFVDSKNTTAEEIIRNSWIALRRAKEEGRDTFRYYNEEMDIAIHNRASMVSDLRRALQEGELSIFYQPQYDLNTHKLTGAEALLRWIKPDGTFIPPDQFIPEAERSGLIVPIGEWVLRNSCTSMIKWHDAGIDKFPIAVNISMEQIQNADLLELVHDVLQTTNIDPQLLKLEVTESMVMGDVEHAIKVLQELKKINVKLSIDDFGTGYSSLAYLRRLEVDQLKVDKSFIHDMTIEGGDALIAEAIITLSHSLNLSVIAEGVESEAHEIILRGFGCEEAQGFLYSRPLPETEFLDFIKSKQE